MKKALVVCNKIELGMSSLHRYACDFHHELKNDAISQNSVPWKVSWYQYPTVALVVLVQLTIPWQTPTKYRHLINVMDSFLGLDTVIYCKMTPFNCPLGNSICHNRNLYYHIVQVIK